MTWDDELRRLRHEGVTYLQVEISLSEGPYDVTVSAMDVEGRGRTLDEAVRDLRARRLERARRLAVDRG